MSDELTTLSVVKLAALMRARRLSPVEVVEAYLSRIEHLNPRLNALVTLDPEALDRAREAEAEIMRGRVTGALHGVPLTIKDTIETRGLKTTSGSLLRAAYLPREDAPAVARLRAAGAIILGKTNVPEMAIPYECDNPVFGRTGNPHDTRLTPGGSSGGEAAAISACLSPAGLGSDLSGSIRVPAHFCGITGLKPTRGRVPGAGHFPSARGAFALGAVIGPMARHVEDLSLILKVLTKTDGGTPGSAAEENESAPGINLKGQRVATFIDENAPVTDETHGAILAAARSLSEAGLLIAEERPPGLGRATALWPALFLSASTTQLREAYTAHEEQAGPLVRATLASVEKTRPPTPAEMASARAELDALLSALIAWMETTPFIIAPVGSVPAFEHGARRVAVDGREISVFRAFGYSRAFNVLGLPAVVVPAGRSRDGLPLGVQIVGRPFEEEKVLAAASIIEEALGGWVRPRAKGA